MNPERAYDVMTDKFDPDTGMVDGPPHGLDEVVRDIRQRALYAALQAAKLGLAHDVYQTATRYARWLAGGDVEPTPALPFAERLAALVDECKRSGEVDDDLVIHHMQIVMGIAPSIPLRTSDVQRTFEGAAT